MNVRVRGGRMLAVGGCVVLTATGCAFHGLNSLPLPGAVGRGPGANVYHVEVPNVGTMESNSPVMINDIVVGSVGMMKVKGWHADVEISVQRDIVVPANVEASVGQTSLLGSMHLELNTPPGQSGSGRLQPGATIPLTRSSAYPSTEQTLSSLGAVVNGGGLGQIGEVIHNFSAALSGRAGTLRDLLTRLDTFVGTLDQQRNNIVDSIQALNRLAGTFAGQRDVLTEALRKIPPALDVLIRERPRLTTALDKLRVFSNTATRLINDTQADLVTNLQNLEPTIRALADVGPEFGAAVAAGFVFPFTQNFVDRAVRGDYFNLHVQLDLSIPRLKRGLMLGTHFGQLDQPLVPTPGEPYYLNYTLDPLNSPLRPPWIDPDALPLPPLPGPPPYAAPLPGPMPGLPPRPGPQPSAAPMPGPPSGAAPMPGAGPVQAPAEGGG
ncbi:MAG: phospholipid/cholesterol/gamma-HCH transport system substrate-binding protein [Mycobacterium sp.]|jgi:virulence factor Mce-like protein|nr:phospholipid/cholesterol/gamma-HCH transport system substrate-binding protein [Mycobacterium sp.]MDT5173016.1 phospholipid/cholesterol/gamma-HCH transport system substrate-binding protein [Mycobacterium sp.]